MTSSTSLRFRPTGMIQTIALSISQSLIRLPWEKKQMIAESSRFPWRMNGRRTRQEERTRNLIKET